MTKAQKLYDRVNYNRSHNMNAVDPKGGLRNPYQEWGLAATFKFIICCLKGVDGQCIYLCMEKG